MGINILFVGFGRYFEFVKLDFFKLYFIMFGGIVFI